MPLQWGMRLQYFLSAVSASWQSFPAGINNNSGCFCSTVLPARSAKMSAQIAKIIYTNIMLYSSHTTTTDGIYLTHTHMHAWVHGSNVTLTERCEVGGTKEARQNLKSVVVLFVECTMTGLAEWMNEQFYVALKTFHTKLFMLTVPGAHKCCRKLTIQKHLHN